MIAAALTVMLSAAPATNVVLMPLQAGEGVSKKQARGVDALARKAVGETGFLTLVKRRRDDVKVGRRCLLGGTERADEAPDVDEGCALDAAQRRAADVLAIGVLHRAEDGFLLRAVVVEPAGDTRDVEVGLAGYRLGEDLEIAVRKLFAPASLAGGLFVTGPAGTRIFVDDKDAGLLPMDAIEGLVEGEHVVRAEREGYISQTHRVKVFFREMSTLELVLTKTRGAAGDAEEAPPLSPLVVAGGAVAGTGAGLLVGGVVAGLLSFLAEREVAARADAQMLTFPRDASLVQRGKLLTLAADGLFLTGLLGIAAGGAVAGWAYLPEDDGDAERLGPAAEGAPDADELVPALEGL